MTQTTLFTHTDLDGAGCAVVLSSSHDGRLAIAVVENGAISDRVKEALAARIGEATEHEIIVSDHGVDASTADAVDEFVRAGGTFHLLDHHRSSQHLAGRTWAIIDESRCATGLVFDHVDRPPALAEFVYLVEDRDLWRNQDPRSKRLATLEALLGPERFIERFRDDPNVELCDAERVLVDHEDARQEDYLSRKTEQAWIVQIDNERWAFCYAEENLSALSERLMVELGAVATAIVNAGNRTVSLRSRGTDVAALAQCNGGGGHPRAAAFSFRGSALESDLTGFEAHLREALSN